MEKRIRRRYIYFSVCLLLAFAYLVYGLVSLQIVNADQYASSAVSQNTQTIKLTGIRGMITDADSVVLAQSERIYNLTFQRTSDENSSADYTEFTTSIKQTIDILNKYGCELSVTFPIVRSPETGLWEYSFGTGISQEAWDARLTMWRKNHYLTDKKYDDPEVAYERLRTRYKMTDMDLSEDMSLKIMAVYSEMQMNLFNSVPIVIAKDISFSAVSEIEGRSMVLRGMTIQMGENRTYPRSNMAAQLIGYTGAISSQTQYNTELKSAGYSLNDRIGKDGVEKSMENWLTANVSSRQGSRVMEKDANGKLTREISSSEPQDGNNVKLTIIASYQQEAERAIAANVENTRNEQEKTILTGTWLEKNKEKLASRNFDRYPLNLADTGVLVVLEIATGKVLALAQYPTYDLNAMVAGGKASQGILLDERNITMNYAIHTRAEPGSIFKMVTGMAALVNGVITPTSEISDMGPFDKYTTNKEEAPTCWANADVRRRDHQNQTIEQGLSHSCNYFFYTLGSLLYEKNEGLLYKYAAEIGLTSKTGIDLPGELRSIVGNQTNLYDQTVSISEQMTEMPSQVANSLKKHFRNIGASYGITYSEERLNTCIKQLMDMAVSHDQGSKGSIWLPLMRQILQQELGMTLTMVNLNVVIQDAYNYLNEIKWGGSLEIQMAIGQSITLLTPVAVSRYVAALGNGGTVYNLMLVDSIISPDGEIISQRMPNKMGSLTGAWEYLPYILEGMRGVVDDSGTANKYFKGWKYADEIRAKTGTSQITIGGVKLDVENNAWFVSLAPFDTPEIAVISFIPNGYSGGLSSVAARDFIEWWLDEKTKTIDNMSLAPGNELTP